MASIVEPFSVYTTNTNSVRAIESRAKINAGISLTHSIHAIESRAKTNENFFKKLLSNIYNFVISLFRSPGKFKTHFDDATILMEAKTILNFLKIAARKRKNAYLI